MNGPSSFFAGGGRMAGAMIRGMIAAGVAPRSIFVADPSDVARAAWSAVLPADHVFSSVADLAAAGSGTLVLAVKPQQMDEVLRDAGSTPWPLVLSIAAGVKLAKLERAFRPGTAVVRAMPNTPALIGRGMTVIAGGAHADERAMREAERLLGAIGDVLRADDNLLDAVTAISGSGPAYFLLVMKELCRAAEELGIEPATAKRLVLTTAAGAAELALQEGVPLEEMIAAVASKGGTTERALAVFRDRGLGEIIAAAARAAFDRSRELGK